MLVFNGEIYNYLELRDELATSHGAVFATDGDGEAVVAGYHYWGTDVLTRLRGMFAFALWDTVTRELFCARDPFGIKPLFMATGAGGTAVASEKKCLLDLAELIGFDTRIDERAVQHYTVLQYVPSPRRCTAGCAGWDRAATPGSAPTACNPRSPGTSCPGSPPPRSPAAASRPGTTRSPRCSRTRWPSTCAPT
ncbi:aluminum induced family protein [Mycobacterium intracellulare MIN_061107_1834]|nr:aluminum induced family protein [Mycobacterium intracellulare MIN_061107_1834]